MENLKEKNSMSRKCFGQGDAGQVAGQNSAGQTPDKFLRDMPRAGQRGTSPSTHLKRIVQKRTLKFEER